MLKIIGYLALGIVVLVAAILVFATTRASEFRVERSIAIKASPDKVAALIDDFHNWPLWSPYEKLDPAMTRNISGAPAGKGAIYEWQGNSKAGQGRMEILDVAADKVTIKLDFIKPFEGHNVAEFTLAPTGDTTQVTWAMFGPTPYVAKVMGIFFSMDQMIGQDFEAGLANLKTVAEK